VNPHPARRALAELLGTGLLVMLVVGSGIMAQLALARVDRAGVPAAHGDYGVGRAHDLVGQRLGVGVGEVDATPEPVPIRGCTGPYPTPRPRAPTPHSTRPLRS
jgi:hypothetical protein